jgi:hypothetical protein
MAAAVKVTKLGKNIIKNIQNKCESDKNIELEKKFI